MVKAAPFVIGSLVSIFVIIDCLSLALSIAASIKVSSNYSTVDESGIAVICNGVFLGVSFIILLFVSLPACACSCDDDKKCCLGTYYVSVLVAGSITVIGTLVAGILQIFSVSNNEEIKSDSEVASVVGAAAAFNLIAAVFGVIVIAVTIGVVIAATFGTCRRDKERHDKEESCYSMGCVTALILVNFLLISSMVAFLLTLFISFFITNYSADHGDSANYDRATVAAFFSGCVAGCLLIGLCIGGPIICSSRCGEVDRVKILSIVLGSLAAGTIIAGGLMMKVGQSFSSEEMLTTDAPLNRASISAMGYLFGALNFVTTIIAIVLFCSGVFICTHREKLVHWTFNGKRYI